MCIFKKYKNIFGEPKKGLHSFRIFDIAMIDLILTVLLAYIISKKKKYNFKKTFFYLFLSGIILHQLFCVETTINNLLFK
tara:strand:- start:1515 stop:1754 length:240 start_codon:yes stop_codon:yes gene_type:complete